MLLYRGTVQVQRMYTHTEVDWGLTIFVKSKVPKILTREVVSLGLAACSGP